MVTNQKDWDLYLRFGSRLHDQSWIVQPIFHWYAHRWLSLSVNDGRMVEYLLDQAPEATLTIKAPGFPMQTSVSWFLGQWSWQVSLAENWKF